MQSSPNTDLTYWPNTAPDPAQTRHVWGRFCVVTAKTNSVLDAPSSLNYPGLPPGKNYRKPLSFPARKGAPVARARAHMGNRN